LPACERSRAFEWCSSGSGRGIDWQDRCRRHDSSSVSDFVQCVRSRICDLLYLLLRGWAPVEDRNGQLNSTCPLPFMVRIPKTSVKERDTCINKVDGRFHLSLLRRGAPLMVRIDRTLPLTPGLRGPWRYSRNVGEGGVICDCTGNAPCMGF